jgi:CRISPR-associated protein Csb2
VIRCHLIDLINPKFNGYMIDHQRDRSDLVLELGKRQNHAPPASVARFAITSKVLPAITEALSLSERFHQALCYYLRDRRCPTLTGVDENGEKLHGNDHVYFLPECNDHGYMTHMTLFADRGFDDTAFRAFAELRKVWGAKGFDVEIVLLATGHPVDFASSSSDASPYFQPSKVWTSITPFIPVRHLKINQSNIAKEDPTRNNLPIGSPAQDCWRLLDVVAPSLTHLNQNYHTDYHAENRRPELLIKQVQIINPGSRIQHGIRDIPCLNYKLQRRTGNGIRVGQRGYALQIEFQKEAILPFGLGYGGHFGLGLFVPNTNNIKPSE